MSKLGRNGIELNYETTHPTNNNNEISAEDDRATFEDFNDSKFNLNDDDSGDMIFDNSVDHNLRISTKVKIKRLENLSYGVIPLFYVDIEVSGSSITRKLQSFSSNNPTVNVSESERNNLRNNFTITFTETYGTNYQMARFVNDGVVLESTPIQLVISGVEYISLKGSGSFTWLSASDSLPKPNIGNTTSTYRVYFFSADLIYMADF